MSKQLKTWNIPYGFRTKSVIFYYTCIVNCRALLILKSASNKCSTGMRKEEWENIAPNDTPSCSQFICLINISERATREFWKSDVSGTARLVYIRKF